MGTAGAEGLFTDSRAIGADWKFVAQEMKIAFSGGVIPSVNSYDNGSAMLLGVGLGLAALPKTLYTIMSNGPINAGPYIMAWYFYSDIGVNNIPSAPAHQ